MAIVRRGCGSGDVGAVGRWVQAPFECVDALDLVAKKIYNDDVGCASFGPLGYRHERRRCRGMTSILECSERYAMLRS